MTPVSYGKILKNKKTSLRIARGRKDGEKKIRADMN